MGWLSPGHWIIILIVAVLLFGNRLPEIARSLGRSFNEFKRGMREVKDNFDDELNSDPPARERLQPPPRSAQPRRTDVDAAPIETEKEPTSAEKHQD